VRLRSGFYRELIERLGLAHEVLPDQNDTPGGANSKTAWLWPFAAKTRDEWTKVFIDSDACVTPCSDMDECVNHPHAEARGIFVRSDGVVEPGPAPDSAEPPERYVAPRSIPAPTRAARYWPGDASEQDRRPRGSRFDCATIDEDPWGRRRVCRTLTVSAADVRQVF